ncbi:mannose-1-phosphate guanylyltransferase/mannose-6-phosphate isomerase [Yersinia enterocolitica]|uniref:mannose-1-phosphate guanylyltransferase/mannose-6-phosphate isomerase n=1 Tax=Yersinia enterocolitica TaxID=630 RepID=UPI00094B7CF8|nr:mannose-1-phosphate guanylyltransferase/mannose-6-phosphate isomerase [Yersinia enterocolitica]HDM8440042.1 mannose-1-phosphate guanylyltransferase/mannose-6-phosphate isomerase [Yersinia enterocolitica]
MLLPVIMAGGTGSRLWPMSRELYPKQFLRLHGVNSMLQETVNRLEGISVREPVVICNEEHRFLVAEQLRQINKLSHNIILEPVGRNTAPAIALAALNAISQGDDPIMLVLAADHIINDCDAFHQAITDAIPFAKKESLVTFGIVPTGPETGYGYIQRGESTVNDISEAFKVKRFVEKPNLETAEQYINSGEYYWNSGMFMFRAKRYIQELDKFRPDILEACKAAMKDSDSDKDFITIDKDKFSACPDESIDYAVMEQTSNAVVVPLDAGWSDIVVNEQRFNVNRITVKPGGTFFMQMHHHRAEHWIVLSGTAKVTIGDKTFLITENQSTFIPIGSLHMLENPGKIPLELIEVQSGSYLGDDDIIRVKDHYGRC